MVLCIMGQIVHNGSDGTNLPSNDRRTMSYSQAQFIAAIPGTGGIKQLIAKKLNCTRKTVYNRVTKNKAVRNAIEAEELKEIDTVEGVLLVAARKGEPWAVKMWLSCRDRERWSQRVDLQGQFNVSTKSEIVILKIPDNRRGVKIGNPQAALN